MEIFKQLKQNKDLIIAQKKSVMKKADSFNFNVPITQIKDDVIKAINPLENVDLETINVSVVINTTNIMDSHNDVHIPGIWTKSLNEKKALYLLQEHELSFEKIITDNLKAYTKQYSFSELGYPELKGTTEALMFDAVVDSDRNEFMFEQYLKGYVKNHSVGMQYVKLFLCINSNEAIYKEEKDNWNKYISYVANQDKAIESGYFWAVTEAKIVEGSAVPIGSNYATPTISVSATQNIEAEPITSSKEKQKQLFFINQLKQTNEKL
jgi:hypothetical protein